MEPVSLEGYHKAVDVQAVRGTPALSPIDGVVANVKYEPRGLGLQVQVMGKDKKLHTLAHLDRVSVGVGSPVKADQQVGEVGDSGAGATGPHLDYRRQTADGEYDDPTADLGPLAQMPRADKPPGWEPSGEMGGGQDYRDSPGEQTRDRREMDRNYRRWNDPRWGEFAMGQEPQNWSNLPAADEHNAGIPAWVLELSQRYNIPPEMIAPDLVDRGYDIPGNNRRPYEPTQARQMADYGRGQDMVPAGYKTHWDVGVGQFEGFYEDPGQFGGEGYGGMGSGYADPYSMMGLGGQGAAGGYGADPQYGSYTGGWNPQGSGYESTMSIPHFGTYGAPDPMSNTPQGLGSWYDSFPGNGPQGPGGWYDSFPGQGPPSPGMSPYDGGGQYGSTGFGNPGFNYGSNYGGSAWSVPSPPGMGGYGGGGAYGSAQPQSQLGAPGFSGTPSGYRDMSAPMGGSRQQVGSMGSRPQPSTSGARSQSASGAQSGYGGGRDTMPFEIPEGGVFGQSKWLPGSTGTDIFLRRGDPITAKTGGRVLYATGGTGLSGGSDTIAQFDDGTVARFRHVQPGLQAGATFRAGQTIATIGDQSMDMLNPQVAGQIGAPDGYQHLDLSINSPGQTQFSPQGGGGGQINAAQWLQQHGYRGRVVGRTPGPQEGQMGGGFGGGGGGFGQGGFPGFPGMFGGGFGRGQDVGAGADFSLMPASATNLALIKSQGWDPSAPQNSAPAGTPGSLVGAVPFSTQYPGPTNAPWTPALPGAPGVPATPSLTPTSPAGTPGTPGGLSAGGLGGWNATLPQPPAGWSGGAFDPFVRPGRVQMFERPDPATDRLPWLEGNQNKAMLGFGEPYAPNLGQSQQWGGAAQAMITGAPPPQNYASGIQGTYQSPPWLSAGAGGGGGGIPAPSPPPATPTLQDMARLWAQRGFIPTDPRVGGGQDSHVLDAVNTDRGWVVPDVGVGQSPYDAFGSQGTNPYSGFSGGDPGGGTPQTQYGGASGGAGGLGFTGGTTGGAFGSVDPSQMTQPNYQGQLAIGPTEAASLNQSAYGLLLNTGQLGVNNQLAYNTMMGTQGQLQQLDDQYRQYYDALRQQYAIHGNDDAFRRDELALQNQWSQQRDQLQRDLGMMQYGTQQQGNAVNLTGLQLNYNQQMARLQQEWQIHGDDDRYRNDVLALQKQTQDQANNLAWGQLGNQEAQYVRSLEQQRSQFGQTLGFNREQLAAQMGLSHEQLAAQVAQAQAQDKQARDLAALQAQNQGYDRQFGLAQTALRNPWVQQLAEMAPAYNAPGGPGAAYAAAAAGRPVGWTGGGQDSGPDRGWNPVGVGAASPYDAWGGDPTGYGMGPVQRGGGGNGQQPTSTSQSGLGFDQGFRMLQGARDQGAPDNAGGQQSNMQQLPRQAADPGWYQGYQAAYGQSTGGNPSPYDLNNDQVVDIRDFGLWRAQQPGNPPPPPTPGPPTTYTPNPPSPPYPTGFPQLTGGFNPAPLYTPPPQPGVVDYSKFISMSPFERAGLRTQSELSGLPWEQYEQNLRTSWGANGGPITAPMTSQLAAQQYQPLDVIGRNQIAEAFGQSPDQYWKAQTRGWAPSQWAGATQQI